MYSAYAELEANAPMCSPPPLTARGAGRGVIVGLCLERSTDLIVSLLAILKTGAAYLPLDPSYPAERVAFMIEDSNAPLIVASPTTEFKFRLDPKKDRLSGRDRSRWLHGAPHRRRHPILPI